MSTHALGRVPDRALYDKFLQNTPVKSQLTWTEHALEVSARVQLGLAAATGTFLEGFWHPS